MMKDLAVLQDCVAVGRRKKPQLQDWPTIDERQLAEPIRTAYNNRYQAVRSYVSGQSLKDIFLSTGVNGKCLSRVIDRANSAHADGRLWGYRALIPHARVRTYERHREPAVLRDGTAGNAGVFAQLLTRYPKLNQQLLREIRTGNVSLKPGGERGRLSGLNGALSRFYARCRELGLTAGDYPLNQKDKASRSLARTLRALMARELDESGRAAGIRVKPASALRTTMRDGPAAFDTVEFDAHKLDLRLKVILERDPIGGEHAVPIERVWLLAIIDVATRCILGWHLGLGRECNRFDAVEAFFRSVVPRDPPELSLPGTRLLASGGYASHNLKQTRYAIWRQIRLDNARAHLASTCIDLLCDTLGCEVDFGPAYEADERPFIERFFGTVVTTFSQRLPGAIEPKDSNLAKKVLARLRGNKSSDRLLVTIGELEELLSMMVWNYNGTPHSALGGLTPLEVMHHHVLGIGRDPVLLRHLPETYRLNPRLLHDPVDCVVHGQAARGERPYITYMHVRYSSDQLSRRSDLLGKAIRVHIDPQDLRELTAVAPGGEVLSPLLASGPWRTHRHSLWLRREFFSAKRARKLDHLSGLDPIASFMEMRKREAVKSKRAASAVARAQHESRPKPTFASAVESSSQTALTSPSPSPSTLDPMSQMVSGPVVGKTLRIARGFAR